MLAVSVPLFPGLSGNCSSVAANLSPGSQGKSLFWMLFLPLQHLSRCVFMVSPSVMPRALVRGAQPLALPLSMSWWARFPCCVLVGADLLGSLGSQFSCQAWSQLPHWLRVVAKTERCVASCLVVAMGNSCPRARTHKVWRPDVSRAAFRRPAHLSAGERGCTGHRSG